MQRQLHDADQYPESEDSNRSESTTENLQRDLDELVKEKAQLEKVGFIDFNSFISLICSIASQPGARQQ